MAKVVYITLLGNITVVDLSSLEEWQAAVGGNVEQTYIDIDGVHVGVMVNEDGIYVCPVVNERASELAGTLLVGDVFLVGPPDRHGNTLDVEPKVIAACERLRREKGMINPRELRGVYA